MGELLPLDHRGLWAVQGGAGPVEGVHVQIWRCLFLQIICWVLLRVAQVFLLMAACTSEVAGFHWLTSAS